MQVRNQRRDALEHRERILQTARSLFKEHGVDQVSMHQIAKTAGVGQGTLYRRYGNKGELCYELIKDSFLQFKEKISAYLLEASALPASCRMSEVLNACVDFIEEKVTWLSAIQTPADCVSGKMTLFDSPPYAFLHATYKALIEEEYSNNERKTRPDPNFTAHAILAAIRPDVYRELRIYQEQTPEQIKQNVKMLFVDTLFK